jgi:hypothetical protein
MQYGVTRDRLAAILRDPLGWDIVHFSCHGLAGSLILEGEYGGHEPLVVEALSELLRPAKSRLKLVTLSSCASASRPAIDDLGLMGIELARLVPPQNGSTTPVASLAQKLSERLDCAVLAMRYPVFDDFAVHLDEGLYDALVGLQHPLAKALQLALAEAVRRPPVPGTPAISVATPALFGTLASRLCLSPPRGGLEISEKSQIDLRDIRGEPERFVGRFQLLTRLCEILVGRTGKTGALITGIPGAGKSACALEVTHRNADRFETVVWYEAPSSSTDAKDALEAFALGLEGKLSGVEIVHLLGNARTLKRSLQTLSARMDRQAILIVLDNIDSLLTARGAWRDNRWALIVRALLDHDGPGRVIITSRRALSAVDPYLQVETVGPLSLAESMMLVRELPNLGGLLRGDVAGIDPDDGRELVRRTLQLSQGHPKLLELADGQAAEPENLRRRLDAARGSNLDSSASTVLFESGASILDERQFVNTLESWTRGILLALPEATRVVFGFLCTMESTDRRFDVAAANWPAVWSGAVNGGELPELESAIQELISSALISQQESNSTRPVHECYDIHPALIKLGQKLGRHALRSVVDQALASHWEEAATAGVDEEDNFTGSQVIDVSLRAVPYLLRLSEWDRAAALIEQVLVRDRSVARAGSLVTALRRVATATANTATGWQNELLLAGALRFVDPHEAESLLRRLYREAVEQGVGNAGLIGVQLALVLRDHGDLQEALKIIDDGYFYFAEGSWSRLGRRAARLTILATLDRNEEVLTEVEQARLEMATLPEESEKWDSGLPWAVREEILGTAALAAQNLRRWKLVLELTTETVESMRARGASPLEMARERFNTYGSLMELGLFEQARTLLRECRDIFEAADDVALLGGVFGALGEVELQLGHRTEAAEMQGRGLRYKYIDGDTASIIRGHWKLADALFTRRSDLPSVLPHVLGAAIIEIQSGGVLTDQNSEILRMCLAATDGGPPVPQSFGELRSSLESVEGVRFGELMSRLSHGDQECEQRFVEVLGMTRNPAEQLMVQAIAQAAGGDQEAAEALTMFVQELARHDPGWVPMQKAIRKLVAGGRDRRRLVAGLESGPAFVLSQSLRLLRLEEESGGD